jgi:hypothetical protein
MIFRLKKNFSVQDLKKKIKFKFYGNNKKIISNFCSIKYSNLNSISFLESVNIKNYKKKRGNCYIKKKKLFF